jgi:phospholipase C
MRDRPNRGHRMVVWLGFAAALLGAGIPLGAALAGSAGPTATERAPGLMFDRVFIIVLENTDFDQAMRAPFLHHLATRGTLFTDYHAITYPSYPNYLAMATGSTFGIHNNSPQDLDVTSLVDLLEPAGVSWKVYAEDLPSPCFLGAASPDDLYVRKHEPYISLRNIQTNPARCARIVNATQLAIDLAQDAVPQYSLYVPNMRHGGHDAGIGEADAWLQGFLTPLLTDPHFMRRTLLVVTFDEDSGFSGNHIYTVAVGEMVQPGATNGNSYNHYSLLRLIEDNYGVGTLGREDAKATIICCIWKK